MRTAILAMVLAFSSSATAETFHFDGMLTEVITRCRPDYCGDVDDIDIPPVGTDITGLFTQPDPDGDPQFGHIEYRFEPWSGSDGLWEPEPLPDGRLLYRGFGMAALEHDNGQSLTWANVELAVQPNWEDGEFILDLDLTGTGSEGFHIRADVMLRPVPEPSTGLLAMVALGIAGTWRWRDRVRRDDVVSPLNSAGYGAAGRSGSGLGETRHHYSNVGGSLRDPHQRFWA